MTPETAFAIGRHSTVFQGDARELVRELPEASVHLTFTSPPYHQLKDYGPDPDRPENLGRRQPYADYLATMAEIFAGLHRATVPGGKLLLQSANIKPARLPVPQVVPLHWDLTRLLLDAGFVFYDEIVWLKKESYTGSAGGRPLFGSYPYPGNPKMLNQLWENISVLTKPGPRPRPSPADKEASRLSRAEWHEWTHGVWRIESKQDPAHPATFNAELAERVVRLYSFRGETVLDPFAGTGTTVIAAEQHGRRGLGFELQRQYCAVAHNRGQALLQLGLNLPEAETQISGGAAHEPAGQGEDDPGSPGGGEAEVR